MFTGEVIGYLGADAKVKEQDGKTTISFAVSSNHKTNEVDSEGRKIEKVQWISCFLNRQSGISEFLKKGTYVYVTGDVFIDVFTKEDGTSVPSITMNVGKIELLAKKDS